MPNFQQIFWQISKIFNIFYSEYGEWKYLHKIDESTDQLKQIKETYDELNTEVESMIGRGFGIEEIRKNSHLIIPWVVDAEMKNIPCV